MLESLLMGNKESPGIKSVIAWNFNVAINTSPVYNSLGEAMNPWRGTGKIVTGGYDGNALQFYGDGSWRQHHAAWMDFDGKDFEIEAMVYQTARNLWCPIFTRVLGNGTGSQALALYDGKLDFYWVDAQSMIGQRLVSNSLIPLNTWTKVSVKRKYGMVELFINDVSQGQKSIGTIAKTINRLHLGGDGGSDNRFNGSMKLDNLKVTLYD